MNNAEIHQVFSELSTPLITDACLRLQIPLRFAAPVIEPVIEWKIASRALPARHYGSVDIFLEAMGTARRSADGSYTFRRQLRTIGGAIEE
jgi:hypothetical protein